MFLILTIKKVLRLNSEDTEVSLLRILSKSIFKSVKRFEAFSKSLEEKVLRSSGIGVLMIFCFSLSDCVLLSAAVLSICITLSWTCNLLAISLALWAIWLSLFCNVFVRSASLFLLCIWLLIWLWTHKLSYSSFDSLNKIEKGLVESAVRGIFKFGYRF